MYVNYGMLVCQYAVNDGILVKADPGIACSHKSY